MKRIIIFIILALISNTAMQAQEIDSAGTILPYTVFAKYRKLFPDSINTFQLQAVDNEKECAKHKILEHIAIGQDVDINFKRKANKVKLPNGDKIWLLRVYSPTAKALGFVFNKTKLPKGAILRIMPEQVFEPKLHEKEVLNEYMISYLYIYTSAILLGKEKFYVYPTKGEVCYLEYFEPAKVEFTGKLYIQSIYHDFRGKR